MKDKIYIDQKHLMDICPSIKSDQAILLIYLRDLHQSLSQKVEKERISGYTWINYHKAATDLPILQVKTPKSIKDKIDQLENLGLIDTFNQISRGYNRKYFKVLPQLLTNVETLKKYPNFDLVIYQVLLEAKVNEQEAIIISLNTDFLSAKRSEIMEVRNAGEGEYSDKRNYLIHMYQTFCEEKEKNK